MVCCFIFLQHRFECNPNQDPAPNPSKRMSVFFKTRTPYKKYISNLGSGGVIPISNLSATTFLQDRFTPKSKYDDIPKQKIPVKLIEKLIIGMNYLYANFFSNYIFGVTRCFSPETYDQKIPNAFRIAETARFVPTSEQLNEIVVCSSK